MSTCNRLDLQTLGSQPVLCPKIPPITGRMMGRAGKEKSAAHVFDLKPKHNAKWGGTMT